MSTAEHRIALDAGVALSTEREATVVAAAPAAERWLALDLFRFVAVCLMVQGHVFTTLLDSSTRSQAWFPHHQFVHGYTAPMFLFGGGLAFGFTTFRNWDAQTKGGAAALKRFKRYWWLLAIGYALHLPTLSLDRLLAMDDPLYLTRFLQVDVLQHLAVTLAFAQFLVLLLKKERIFAWVIGLLGAFAIVGAPWIWSVDTGAMPIWLAGFVNAQNGSTFPLVPWAGFTYCGIVVAYAVGVGATKADSVSKRLAWPFAALSAAFIVVPILVDRFGPWPWPEHNFWKTNPLFFFWRLGNVLAVLALLCFAERGLKRMGMLDAAKRGGQQIARSLLGWMKLVGQESLIIYVVHLIILHGTVLGRGLKHPDILGTGSQNLLNATLISIALFLTMVVLARSWAELKKVRASFNLVQFALTSVFAYLMLTR